MAVFTLDLTFARGSDVSTAVRDATFVESASQFPFTAYWVGPLPDIVLAPLSVVQLTTRAAGMPATTISLGPVIVTLTPNLPASQASIVEATPLWLPLPVLPDET